MLMHLTHVAALVNIVIYLLYIFELPLKFVKRRFH
jgi:hypothetical protein